jgi:CheY-like chemotaxis protein
MEPKAAIDGLPAGSHPRTVARVFSLGLVNGPGLAVPAQVLPEKYRVARAVWLKCSLLLFTAALWCLALHGATQTNAIEFQNSITKPGTIQWEINQRHYKDLQERHRKRLAVPDVFGTNVPVAAGAYLAFDRKLTAPPPPASAGLFGVFLKLLFYTAVLIVAGVLALRRFAPHVFADLDQRYNPWAIIPVAERDPAEKVRAEEEAFGRFLETFRIGPSSSPAAASPANDDPLGEFYARIKNLVAAQRKLLQESGRVASDAVRHAMLKELHHDVGRLKGEAAIPGALPVWQVASAVEGLLHQLTGKMRDVSSSTLRTVGGGLELLDDLCVPGLKLDFLTDKPFKFLVVDDDMISRQALSASLKKAFNQPDLAENGESALEQAARQAYDVIFLDVEMPGMDGFELCMKIRGTDSNRTTPVVFVTSHSDFDVRAESTLSGGNDLVGKPFLMFEITVKAITLAFQGRLRDHAPKPLARPKPRKQPADVPLPVVDRPRPVSKPADVALAAPSTSPPTEADELVNTFLTRASKNFGPLQELCHTILQTADEASRQTLLADAFLRINSLLPQAGPRVAHPVYQMSTALEGLFRKLLQDAKNSTPSTLATIATAVDLLKDLCASGLKADLAVNPPVRMLVVDDDLVTRRAITGALQTALEKPESAEGGEAALALLAEKTYDVIFLDVMMPGMDGFETCAKIRETDSNRATPVVFLTGVADFDARAKANQNGGNDFMRKPFITAEITVKALTFALRGRLHQIQNPAVPVNPPVEAGVAG